MVTNKDIKEVRKLAGSSSKQSNDTESDNDQWEDPPLSRDDILWLLDQTPPDYKMYEISSTFVMFIMKADDKLVESRNAVDCVGPYEIEEHYVQCDIDAAPIDGDDYRELCALACEFTPESSGKLAFAPGRYLLSSTEFDHLHIAELQRSEKESQKTNAATTTNLEYVGTNGTNIPADFELVVGGGEKQKSIPTNKAVLACFLPNFETLLGGDTIQAAKLELPDADPRALELVLDAYTTHKKVSMPSWWSNQDLHDAVQLLKDKFGLVEKNSSGMDGAATKKDGESIRQHHPMLNDARWHDVTFLVGSSKEELKTNRAVLASLNDVMNLILYGTGHISVDPAKPIEWTDYDAAAVRCVFLALALRGKEEVVVPLASVESAKALVSYLIETPQELKIYYETPFKREFEGGFLLDPNRDGGGWLVVKEE